MLLVLLKSFSFEPSACLDFICEHYQVPLEQSAFFVLFFSLFKFSVCLRKEVALYHFIELIHVYDCEQQCHHFIELTHM